MPNQVTKSLSGNIQVLSANGLSTFVDDSDGLLKIKDTNGVECRKDSGIIDESPRAYKSLDAVMSAQKDLVSIAHRLKPLVCVKG